MRILVLGGLSLLALVPSACNQSAEAAAPTRTTIVAESVNDDSAIAGSSDTLSIGPGAAGPIARAVFAMSDAEKKRFEELVGELKEAKDLPAAFALAEKIEAFGYDCFAPLQDFVTTTKDLKPIAKIAAARALFNIFRLPQESDISIKALCNVIAESEDRALRLAAAEVLEDLVFNRHQDLVAKALEKSFDPPVQVMLSVIMYRQWRDADAKKFLAELMKSESINIRVQGAIALGRIGELGNHPKARKLLEELADEPTDRGRLADALLQNYRLFRKLEKKIFEAASEESEEVKIDLDLLNTTIRMIQERFIFKKEKETSRLLLEAAKGVVDGFDPYTVFLPSNLAAQAQELKALRVPSLGFSLGAGPIFEGRRAQLPKIVSVTPGGPADRAGLQPGDTLLGVAPGATFERIMEWRNGANVEEGEFLKDPMGNGLPGLVNALDGKDGSFVGFRVFRESWLIERWVPLQRETMKPEPFVHQTLPGALHYIRLSEINADSPAKMKKALADLEEQEAKGVMLDLRNVSNGSYLAAYEIASLFLAEEARLGQSSGRNQKVAPTTKHVAKGDKRNTTLPMVVVMNKGTADSAEVLAAALVENDRATAVGSATFGRALVQKIIPISSDAGDHALLVTVGKYYTPISNKALYQNGVKPALNASVPEFEGWVYDELDELRISDNWKSYLAKLVGEHKDKAIELAAYDAHEAARYPGWEEFRKGMSNHLTDEHLRWAVRRAVRSRLFESGAMEPSVDLQEDVKFATGLKELAKRVGVNLADFDDYKALVGDPSSSGG